MSLQLQGRLLHWVFRISDRPKSIKFYRDVLGMKILRHEEFSEGCKAACNGPYNGKWSKTMVGYGHEDDHFALELTYNYGEKDYTLGNDFQYITLRSNYIQDNIKAHNYPTETIITDVDLTETFIYTPSGYRFQLIEEEGEGDPIRSITIHVSNLADSLKYWKGILGMAVLETKRYVNGDQIASLSFESLTHHPQASLKLLETFSNAGKPINHSTGAGRIAFSCPSSQLTQIQEAITNSSYKILTPLTSLETPSKPTVQVIILSDPDEYEICFVGDEAFSCRKLIPMQSHF